jgi:plastocyanin
VWVSALGLALAVSIGACGGKKDEALSESGDVSSPAATPSGQKVDAATAADVKGVVSFDGTAPKNEIIKMNADPVCQRESKGEQTQETYMVGSDGKSLANVFVYVKDGLGNYVFDVPTESAKIDQKECRYHPHVFGMRVGQPLEIVNSDPTLHNIHAMPKANQEFNNGQPIQGMKMTHTFTQQEVMVPFKCDEHGWINAYDVELPHPNNAENKYDGSIEFKDLTAGTYTI